MQNWALDADVESLQIDGPLAAGSHGITYRKSSGRIERRIAEVEGERAVIEFPLSGAIGRFVWMFHRVGEGCRITQHCAIEGEQADEYVGAIAPSLEAGIPAGMHKLCDSMESSHR